MQKIIIIGAGAAGLMTAATILEGDGTGEYEIHIFEKNTTPGKKVIISGGGRCNLTTGNEDKKMLASKYTRGWDFIKKSMGKFSPKKVREWFEWHGVPLRIESDLRVFPVSDDGRDIVGVFEDIFEKNRNKVILHYGEGIEDVAIISSDSGDSEIKIADILDNPSLYSLGGVSRYTVITKKGTYETNILVITTGGNAYSHTGSSGDGYNFAKKLGHTITPLGPSLSSFLTREAWLHVLSGLTFENAKIQNLEGPLLLTHFGISGPLAFMLSSRLAFEKIGTGATVTVLMTPLASMNSSDWDIFLREQFQLHPKKFITSILSEKLPRRFAEAFVLEYFSYITDTYVASIGRSEREKLAKLLGDGVPITLLERRPGDEFVTAGGVDTDELDSETMESKIHKNLYFAGEILNVDGYTGGYSLQICWASGYSAGKNIVKNMTL